jgi:hypothetical protein
LLSLSEHNGQEMRVYLKYVREKAENCKDFLNFAAQALRNSAAPQQLEQAPLRLACTSFIGVKRRETAHATKRPVGA